MDVSSKESDRVVFDECLVIVIFLVTEDTGFLFPSLKAHAHYLRHALLTSSMLLHAPGPPPQNANVVSFYMAQLSLDCRAACLLL